MERTTALEFRTQMKAWLDQASEVPIKITRKSGQSYIVVDAEKYQAMELELANLRGLSKGLLDVATGNSRPITKEAIAKATADGKLKALNNRSKKAVG